MPQDISLVKIEFNDIVKYIGPSNDENRDLVPGNTYTVIGAKKDRFDIIDLECGFPIRLSVFKQFVELVKKNPPPYAEKKMLKEEIFLCPCGEEMALTLIDGKFIGTCAKCGCYIEKPKK